MKRSVLVIATVATATLGLTACAGGGPDADSDVVRVAIQPTATGFPMWLAEKQGYYEDNGVEVDFTYYPNGAAMSESGITGAWDAGALGSPPAMTSSDKWDLVVTGADAEESKSQIMWGRTTDFEGEDTAEVLRGGDVLVKTNSTQHYSMLACMQSIGLDESDVNVLPLEADAIPGAFESGEGVAAMTWPPFDAAFVDSGEYMPLCDGSKAGVQVWNMLALTPDFADQRAELAGQWLAATYAANDYITDNPDEASSMLVEFYDENGIESTEEAAAREIEQRTWPSAADALESYRSGEMADSLNGLSDTFVDLGVFESAPDVDALIEAGTPALESAQD
ncbi:ABC transporter substrate-binding protein [Aeromicrobium sp. CF4.19]|uniref:ABC transporter substrate-binding protein n=1 Tax=Aeromicrobium sp. CF4.19 TaxID=3373082 RepID=UPI003EE54249